MCSADAPTCMVVAYINSLRSGGGAVCDSALAVARTMVAWCTILANLTTYYLYSYT